MAIGPEEYARRRQRLMELMEADSIAIIAAASEQLRSNDTYFPFRQNSDFYYLSGFNEPDAVLALIPGREQGEFVMFCRDKHPEKEIWDGFRYGPEGVCQHFAADDAFPIDDIDDILPGLIEGRTRIYYAMGRDTQFDRHVMEWVNAIRCNERGGSTPPGEFQELDHLLHELRLFKSAAEIKVMQKAASISSQAHREAMQACRPEMFEYQLEAVLHHRFAQSAARFPAYNSIVGSGANACVLHYVENQKKMRAGELVLIDAGCEYQNYAADITRTFPVSGCFSAEQQAIYEIVLAANETAIAEAKPGNHWDKPHEVSVQIITQGLLDLGLLDGELNELIETAAYRRFYMHRVGHWLGLDVHDVGDYRVADQWRLLEPGMVMTIEPGIYVSPTDSQVDQKWRGIGVRIEDDIAINKHHCTVLSAEAPKSVMDIEALMAGHML
ncbi:Xaa-Pro aminopeptidase [Pseudoteredinibacter isoporae]|uniref:Xaa-Pro aminopeptidase n=1 Tax=Pseudoteredinibacter isoporae TaxID=570281 RepID=A0A7X0JPL9_9GAMM|nr:Xaa-Pro aminopeptidase [Pseudoteredinibacter isoporae]MBB6519950.1 Xaa-Pro aminopeptidase [Pseudoteredinibacter isoporae]NHO85523.1 Xaa-Pro aminopeptidase [Pseudoteredinibacter isoporae]NIB26025.1 Xaa-Pro aminopeptidase [Pseudoteredinibacter isoporae]